MARKKKEIPVYGTVIQRGVKYYRTRLMDADGRRVALYAQTPEELYEKVREAQRQIEEAVFRKTTPTVAEYWGLSQILCKRRNAVQIEQNLFKAEVAQAAAALFSK